MGDSGDQGQDTDEFTSDAELDQIASDAEAVQGGRSNIVGSDSYDAQFTADNLEARGLPPENFMSAANFAQTRQGGAGGDDSPSVSVPSITAASSTLAPGILGETLSDFQSGVRPDTGRRPMGFDTPANQMLEAAIGTTARIPNVSRETIVDRGAFSPSGQLFPSLSILAGAQDVKKEQSNIRRGLQNLRDQLDFGMGDPGNPTRNPINFGVTQQVVPTTTPTARPENLRQRFDNAAIQEALEAGTLAENLDKPNITDADTTAASEILAGLFDRDPDAIAARSMPGTAVDLTKGTGTTTTGTTRGEDPFDPNVGLPFPVETLERAERLANEKTALERLGLPSFLSAVDPERVSRDLLATSLIAGRPISAVEAIRGVQAPNLQKETMEEYLERTGARIPESQIITDNSGLVVGIKDAQGNLITGMDPNAQQEQGDGGEQITKAPPKAPTDPCPDGYQLIDGKCTPTGATDTGTGFMMFPADRDPAFRRGPFTPTTVATTPNIQALNPVTFGLSNIFRR